MSRSRSLTDPDRVGSLLDQLRGSRTRRSKPDDDDQERWEAVGTDASSNEPAEVLDSVVDIEIVGDALDVTAGPLGVDRLTDGFDHIDVLAEEELELEELVVPVAATGELAAVLSFVCEELRDWADADSAWVADSEGFALTHRVEVADAALCATMIGAPRATGREPMWSVFADSHGKYVVALAAPDPLVGLIVGLRFSHRPAYVVVDDLQSVLLRSFEASERLKPWI